MALMIKNFQSKYLSTSFVANAVVILLSIIHLAIGIAMLYFGSRNMHLSGGTSAQGSLALLPMSMLWAVTGLPATIISVITFSMVKLAKARKKLDFEPVFTRIIAISCTAQLIATFTGALLV